MSPSPEERIVALEIRVDGLHEAMVAMSQQLHEMRAEMNEDRKLNREMHDTIVSAGGGWKALAAAGGLLLFIGVMIDRVIGWATKAF